MKTQNPYLKNRRKITLQARLPSKAKQSFKQETDIHFQIRKYLQTGILPNERQLQFIDLTQYPSKQEMLNMVAHAKEFHDQLSPKLRKQFPTFQDLSDFLEDPDNHSEAIALGLLQPQDDPSATIKQDGSSSQITETTNLNHNETL